MAELGRILGGLFAVAAVAFAVLPVDGATRRRLFTLWGLELFQVGAILLPAAVGSPAVELLYSLLAIVAARELWRCLRAGHFGALARGLIVFGYVVIGFVALMAIARQSFFALAFLYAVIELNDTAAWAMGSAFSGRKLWPRVSPNKTWIGFLAGLAASVLTALLLGFLLPERPPLERAALGLGLGLVGTAGDLFASALKRRAAIRHYAEWFPYQGGVLDLYDSLALASPLWWLYVISR